MRVLRSENLYSQSYSYSDLKVPNVKCEQDEIIAKLLQLRKYLFLSNVLLAVALMLDSNVFIFFNVP